MGDTGRAVRLPGTALLVLAVLPAGPVRGAAGPGGRVSTNPAAVDPVDGRGAPEVRPGRGRLPAGADPVRWSAGRVPRAGRAGALSAEGGSLAAFPGNRLDRGLRRRYGVGGGWA